MDRTAEACVLTPDFYDYPWVVPSSIAVNGRFLRLVWDDGVALDAFDMWLRENAVGTGGVDTATREGLIDPADYDPAIEMLAAHIAADGSVHVQFAPDRVSCSYHPGWLRHVADGQHLATSWIPNAVAWSSNELSEPPTHDGPAVLRDDAAFGAWLNDLVMFGLARLRHLPDDADVSLKLAAKIGVVRDTNFGRIWDVKADTALAGRPDTNSSANTNLRLGPHTDLPTRETPPGFQFLHCYANEAQGGNSTMADGAAVVAALKAEHRDHYDALTTLKWVFFNRGPGIDHRWSGPILDQSIPGAPLTLRAFYPVRGFPDMAPEDMPRAYEAMRCFSALAASDRFQIAYPFEPGDMVVFDNRRMLHGRDPFLVGGHRHLRGIYMDHDDVLSATRVANRRRASEALTNHQPKESQNA